MMNIVAKKITHTVDVGAGRLVAAIEGETYGHGVFYASAADTLTGPVLDQATIFPELADEAIQDNANEAIHRFLPPQDQELFSTFNRFNVDSA